MRTSSCLYTVEQIRSIEQAAYQLPKVTGAVLMARAGEAALDVLRTHWPNAQSIAVVCGGGNNAGDGYVLARLAKQAGMKVWVLCVSPLAALTELAYDQAYQCQKAGVDCQAFSETELETVDVIVDAMLGIGIQGEIKGDYLKAMLAINGLCKPVLSLDVPSGLDANSGQVFGMSIDAEVTLTFIARKQGLFTALGPSRSGKVILDRLGLQESLYRRLELTPTAVCLDDELVQRLRPRRGRHVHKGDCGHALLIGGNYGMGGAICMAAAASARVGAGLVSVATRSEHMNVVTGMRPELMCYGVESVSDLEPLLERSSVIAIGPGLGQDDWAHALLARVLSPQKSMLPIILDADALNMLATPEGSDLIDALAQRELMLTPHPGEAARLLGIAVSSVQDNRFQAIRTLQERYGGVCLLKGAGTLIKGENTPVYLCSRGNPGMASGGMGDVLTGVLIGLMAQGLSSLKAAKMGVLLHAKAADFAAREGGERGLLATDLLPYLRRIMNQAQAS